MDTPQKARPLHCTAKRLHLPASAASEKTRDAVHGIIKSPSRLLATGLALSLLGASPTSELGEWQCEFPDTNLTQATSLLSEIVTDGPRRDTIT